MARVELFNLSASLNIRKCPFLLNEIWHFFLTYCLPNHHLTSILASSQPMQVRVYRSTNKGDRGKNHKSVLLKMGYVIISVG